MAVSDAGNRGWKGLLWLVNPEVCEDQREMPRREWVWGARCGGRVKWVPPLAV